MNTLRASKNFKVQHNVTVRVIDEATGKIVQEHRGHNAATNSMLVGIAHYLVGDGVLNQGPDMLKMYVPQYISLGTLGLRNQDEDSHHLPIGLGQWYSGLTYAQLPKEELQILGKPSSGAKISQDDLVTLQYISYMNERPGFGADGYDENKNNDRAVFGLGDPFTSFDNTAQWRVGDVCWYLGNRYTCVKPMRGVWNPNCWRLDSTASFSGELISPSFPRALISYREIVSEEYAELPETVDVVYSAMVSTGALKQFRGGNDYIFISEAGLWSRQDWIDGGSNGLLAGYRLAPPNSSQLDMRQPENQELLRKSILRVAKNQVVQVIWKIQIGSIDQFGGQESLYPKPTKLQWNEV